MKVEQIAIEDVCVLGRQRAIHKEHITALARSIEKIGLQSPIIVHAPPNDQDTGLPTGKVTLVAGLHRLEAARQLGWSYIPCFYCNEYAPGELDRELIEIDENLVREGLTPAEEAAHMKRREEIFLTIQALEGKPKQEGPGRPAGVASETAKATGTPISTIKKQLARGRMIAPDLLDKIKGTLLDRTTYLDYLKDLDPDSQREKVKKDLQGLLEAENAGIRITATDLTREDDVVIEALAEPKSDGGAGVLSAAWLQASFDARRTFVQEVIEPWMAEATDLVEEEF